ncbi:MAG: TIGR01777 family oxidoreductase [Anaerolineales bacterium]|nr:TIGR01777 family oxidoreductase [Anaerolineales bacterium]
MRVIIPGGSGLIGAALSTELIKNGYEVFILSRQPDRQKEKLPEGVRAVGWDGKSAAGWGSLADGAKAIVNLAGENLAAGRWTEARKQAIRDSRVHAGQAIVQAVDGAGQKPEVVIQASGVGYYGPRQDELVDESGAPGADFSSRVCIEWENATARVEGLGVRRAIIRMGVSLSLHGGALPRMLLPFRLFVGGKIGSGRQYLSWIHLADTVAGIRFLIENPALAGIFNLTSPYPATNAEFSRAIGRAMHRPALMPVPAFAMRLVFGELSSVLLEGQRVIPARLNEAGFKFQYPQAEAALRDVLRG